MSWSNGDLGKLVLQYSMPQSTIAQNVFDIRCDVALVPYSDATMLVYVQEWVNRWAGQWRAGVSGLVTLEQFTLIRYASGTQSAEYEETVPVGVSGQLNSDMLPHGCAQLITRKASVGRGVAKKFIPGVAEERQAEGLIGAPNLAVGAGLGALWVDGIFNYIAAGGDGLDRIMEFGIIKTTPPALFPAFNYLSDAVIAKPIVAYQRRRKVGVGI